MASTSPLNAATMMNEGRKPLLELAKVHKKKLFDLIESGDRDFVAMQAALDGYISCLYSSDILAGFVANDGKYKP